MVVPIVAHVSKFAKKDGCVAEMKALTLSTEKACSQVSRCLKKACPTRWLSFDPSVKAVYADYFALIHTLNNSKDGDATSLGLFTKVKDVTFIGTVYILSELLPHLSTISKAFQMRAVDFSKLRQQLNTLKGSSMTQ